MNRSSGPIKAFFVLMTWTLATTTAFCAEGRWDPTVFTPLEQFSSNQPFTLLVHQMTSSDPLHVPKAKYWRPNPFNLIRNPERIGEVDYLCTTIIDQDHRTTFLGYSGIALVLAAPTNNVIATREVDMNSSPILRPAKRVSEELFREKLNLFSTLFPVREAHEILAATPDRQYNEVLVVGTSTTGSTLRVVGYAVFEVQGQSRATAETLAELEQISRNNGLPIVRIQWDGRPLSNIPERYLREDLKNRPQLAAGLPSYPPPPPPPSKCETAMLKNSD